MKAYVAVFVSVFLAELGDKTQLATLVFASDAEVTRLGVFAAAASALVLSTALAVGVGAASWAASLASTARRTGGPSRLQA